MATNLKPVVLTGNGSKHDVVADGDTLDSSYIDKETLISTDSSNLIKTGTDGNLMVSPDDLPGLDPESLVSAQADNQLSVALDNKLYVPKPEATDPAALVSGVEGNALTVAADNKLFVAEPEQISAADLISDKTDNQITLDNGKLYTAPVKPEDMISDNSDNAIVLGTDNKLYVAEKKVSPSDFISQDVNNSITLGQDQKLYARTVSNDSGNLLDRGTDLGAKLNADNLVSTASTDNLLIVDPSDGKLALKKQDVQIVVQEQVQDVTVVSADSGNIITKGTDGGAMLSPIDLPDQVSAGDGTTVVDGAVSVNVGKGLAVNSTTNKLFVNTDDLDIQTISVAASEAILSLSDNVLSSTVRIAYDSATGYLTLYGKNNFVVAQAFIPGAEQALLGVEVVTNPTGYDPGTYFRYTFTTASGIVKSYVKVPEGSTTAAGNGISVNTSGGVDTVSAVADASKGVVVGSAGIGVVANENKGVTVDSNGVAVKTKSNGGILVDSNGLSVDTSIIPTVEGLEELTDRVDTAESDITGLKTKQGQLEGDLQALDNKVDALELEASSLSISGSAVDPSTLENSQGALYPATNLLS